MVAFRLYLLMLAALPIVSWAHADSGPFGIHAADDYAPGVEQWSKVSDIIHRIKLKLTGMNSSMHLPNPPHISLHRVNMSDGVGLSTILINPYPYDAKKGAVITRSPYGPTSENLADIFVLTNGYAAVLQDDRGTFTSGGKFDIFRTAGSDGLSTMEWVTSQPWSNGKVYTVGVSADGLNEASLIQSKPPMLKGQWWVWTAANGHHFSYPGGAYRKDLTEGYMHFMDVEIHGAGPRAIEEVKEHEALSDFWKTTVVCRNDTRLDDPDCHWREVKWPVLLNTGWWDIFQGPSIDAWNAMRAGSDASVRDKHVHIVSPLGHCTLALTVIHPKLAAAEADAFHAGQRIATEFFAGNFSGPVRSRVGRVNIFLMGGYHGPSKGSWNYWISMEDWPTFTPMTYYLSHDEKKANRRILDSSPPQQMCTAEYNYDPTNPAPMLGGNNLPLPVFFKTAGCGFTEQSSRERRKDVLTFDSAPLAEDMAVVGPVKAKLFVSSSANDTDFFVTLSDYTFGKSTLVRYGMLRMRWRDSESVQSPHLSPKQVYEITVKLDSTAYVFPKGHRVRVSVSSAANPYYNANSNTGQFDQIKNVTPVVAHNVIYMSSEYPSQLVLPIVAIKDLPENHAFPSTSEESMPLVVTTEESKPIVV